MSAVASVHPLHETTTSSSPGAKPASSASRQRLMVVASLCAGITTDPSGNVGNVFAFHCGGFVDERATAIAKGTFRSEMRGL